MYSKSNWAIHAVNVTKKYDLYAQPLQRLKAIIRGNKAHYTQPFAALDGVSVSVRKGATVGIIGENGSGKSTLLQVLCGILTADSGEVHVNGRIASLLELGAGFNQEFTGKENLFLNAAVLGLSPEETKARYEQIVAFADIGEFINSPVKSYSSGMYVRLAFAIAIHVEPDILIVDEALAVGDARFQAKCFNKIQEIREKGTTILFVSHDVNTVRQLCDQAIWLEKGTVKMTGEVLHVTSKYMEALFQPQNDVQDIPVAEAIMTADEVSQPINHWGSNKGNIQYCHLLNTAGERVTLICDNERIHIRMRFCIPEHVNYRGFGVALAVRALNGTDLIVYDTFGQGVTFNPENDMHEIQISMNNPLSEGKYLLVAVLEDRSNAIPSYYEFIEGVQFFSVLRTQKIFGLFVPEIQLKINHQNIYG